MVKQNVKNIVELSREKNRKSEHRGASYEISPKDELIASLANEYENRRARQVYEWELLRRKIFKASA